MKHMICILLLLCVLLGAMSGMTTAVGEAEILFTRDNIIVKEDTTIPQLQKIYGEPTLCTSSAFGGNAYTFQGESAEDYLYVETMEDGSIVLFTIFGGNFQTPWGNSGDLCTMGYTSDRLELYVDDNDLVWGITKLIGGYDVAEKQKLFVKNYRTSYTYAEGIAQHSVLMWNALQELFGYSGRLVYDSRAFFLNRQLMENGSNIDDYTDAIGQNNLYTMETYRNLEFTYNIGRYCPNPGSYTNDTSWSGSLPDGHYGIFDTNMEPSYSFVGNDLMAGIVLSGALDPSYFKSRQPIPLTQTETERFNEATALYTKSVETWNAAVSNYFITEPNISILSLSAGEVHPDILQASTDFLNAIRVGAGLGKLELSRELSEIAQHKAVLVSYCANNNISMDNPHDPPQPNGVSDEFYQKAQPQGPENLYQGNTLTSIVNALDDSVGDPIFCGHRHNLLDPTSKYVGFGSTDSTNFLSQGVHEFSGYQPCQEELIAWPSNGIMLSPAGLSSDTMMTAKFLKNYHFTAETEVIIRDLNTGEEWSVTAESAKESENALHVYDTHISYRNSRISLSVGDIYEITFTNVKDLNSGELCRYSYRSVYINPWTPGDLHMDLLLSSENLCLGMGSRRKIDARIISVRPPHTLVQWSSDAPEIVSVNENGIITAHKPGMAHITAKAGTAIKICTVTVEQQDPCTADHVFGDWQTISETSCVKEGIRVRYCQVCGFSEKELIPTADHVPGEINVLREASCGSYGLLEYECTVCHEGQTVYRDPLGHEWDNGVVTVEPTQNREGERLFTCRRCGATKTETIVPSDTDSCTGGSNCPSAAFHDVPPAYNWAHEGIDFAVRQGLFNGMNATTFAPDQSMTRAMLVTVLWRYEGSVIEGENIFTDVEDGLWYTDAIAWAAAYRIVGGVGNGRFDPNGTITREQLATILYRYHNVQGLDTSKQADLTAFPDSGSVSDWAEIPLSWAVAEGLINGVQKGSQSYLSPLGSATRAQVATILMRYIESVSTNG